MSIAAFGVRKPVAANLLMIAIIGAGLAFGVNLRREFFPETRPNQVGIAAPYPGASPDEIEESLAIKIEDRIADLRGVKEINTTVAEGAASLMVEFEHGVEINDAVQRVKREIDALQDLPERAERITVEVFEPNIPVINVSLYGDADERVLKDALNVIREDLRSLRGMGDVLLSGVRRDEISVEARPAALVEHGLSLPDIARRIRESMDEVPAGAVRTSTANVSVRTLGADERIEEIREIVVKSSDGGRPVKLGEIAQVSSGFADVDVRVRFDDKRAGTLVVYAVGKQDVLDIASAVKAYVAGRNRAPLELTPAEARQLESVADSALLPVRLHAHRLGLARPRPPVALIAHNDLARFVDQRLSLLARNAMWGAILVFITLFVLLALRVAIWVTAGLIIAVMGTLAVMYALDVSLNFLTMFGLIVVLGLLVDDAIVVAENITARFEKGEPALVAAERGTAQVLWPVTATVLTTICAFYPLRLIEGNIGDLFAALPVVVTCALLVSLLESILILPAHMGHSLLAAERAPRTSVGRFFARVDGARTALFQRLLIPSYSDALRACLGARYLTVAVAIAVLVFSLGLVYGERVPFVFIDSADSESVVVELRMPIGSPLVTTDEIVRRIEAAALATEEIEHVTTVVGARTDVDTGGASLPQSHVAQLFIELKRVELRDRRSREVTDSIRRELGLLPGVKSLRFVELQGGPGGADITLTITGERFERMGVVAERLASELREYEGVFNVSDDADRGQRELRFTLREGARELGFTTAQIAEQVRGAIYGLEAYTFAGEREDVDVRVMFAERERRSLASIESARVFTPDGRAVPLSEVVRIEEAEAYATVHRLDRRRAITVTADVDRARTNPEKITAALAPALAALQRDNPGIRILPRGRQKDMVDSFRSLPLGALAAATMIFVILSWLFSSYFQPLVVLAVTPFAMVGAIWGHLLLGYNITILSLIGFVALIGIVVNDSLILIEFFNKRQEEGLSVFDALIAAGEGRFRAILLTTITTVLGLLPLMLEQSFQASFLIPMAITISFGLLAATVITLIVLPALLMIYADASRLARFLWTGSRSPHGPAHHPPDAALIEDPALN